MLLCFSFSVNAVCCYRKINTSSIILIHGIPFVSNHICCLFCTFCVKILSVKVNTSCTDVLLCLRTGNIRSLQEHLFFSEYNTLFCRYYLGRGQLPVHCRKPWKLSHQIRQKHAGPESLVLSSRSLFFKVPMSFHSVTLSIRQLESVLPFHSPAFLVKDVAGIEKSVLLFFFCVFTLPFSPSVVLLLSLLFMGRSWSSRLSVSVTLAKQQSDTARLQLFEIKKKKNQLITGKKDRLMVLLIRSVNVCGIKNSECLELSIREVSWQI